MSSQLYGSLHLAWSLNLVLSSTKSTARAAALKRAGQTAPQSWALEKNGPLALTPGCLLALCCNSEGLSKLGDPITGMYVTSSVML